MNEIEKAIMDLDDLKNCESISSSHFKEVHGKNLELAISALEKQLSNGWIPVSEKLPEAINIISDDYRENYLVCDSNGQMLVCQRLIVFGREHWNYSCMALNDVIAWQNLPEPYKGE